MKRQVIKNLVKRSIVKPLRNVSKNISYLGKVPLSWYSTNNWGDALNPVLVKLLSSKEIVQVYGFQKRHHYQVIGSILNDATQQTEVWGTGLMFGDVAVARPKKIYSVRGPLTRDALIRQGFECPEVYGDPALLLPRFFNPEIEKQYEVGIIPHYVDKGNPWIEQFRKDSNVLILDIESGIQDFVRSLKACENIISSSLHGLICADSYGVPNVRVVFSDKIAGGDFKFFDYAKSVGIENPTVIRIEEGSKLKCIANRAELSPLDIDLYQLMVACPFLSRKLRCEITRSVPESCGLPVAFESVRLDD